MARSAGVVERTVVFNMKKSDFLFELPEELIAQSPIERRERSRLLCMERRTGKTEHRRFYELPNLLREGDCLVLNDSRVLPARLVGRRETGGAAEIVLLREVNSQFTIHNSQLEDRANSEFRIPNSELRKKQDDQTPVIARSEATWQSTKQSSVWECLVRPGRKMKVGTKLVFGNGELTAVVISETDGGNRLIEFRHSGVFLEVLSRLGKMPLPPYIHEELEDAERYQTVYSRIGGSAAAPTAGLHFTNDLLEEIGSRGVEICFITLHVGLGTFRPVKTDEIVKHKMHAEYFIVPEKTAETVNRVQASGGRIIAVGTTSCRALEACSGEAGVVSEFSGFTDIFIYPGYGFKCIDGLITNFHLPESTLIMLVSAFAGRENVLNAYNEAIREKYRFFSFGDAMMML